MKAEYDNELTTEQREKMKKNLIYVGIFSIIMIFAGFTSAYIVSMGDSFWVKYDFPPAFYVSTALIILSSISLQFAISFAKKDFFRLRVNGLELRLKGSRMFLGRDEITDAEKQTILQFLELTDDSESHVLYYKGEKLAVDNGRLFRAEVEDSELSAKEMELFGKYKKQIEQSKNPNTPIIQLLAAITLLLGIGFGWSQLKGYGELVDRGANAVNNILVSNGRYGNYYQLKIDGKYMEVNGNEYLILGKPMSDSQKKAVSEFAGQLVSIEKKFPNKINNYGKYTLLYKNLELRLENGHFYLPDSTELQFVDLGRMSDFATHLRDGRGDFFLKGTFGKDFHIYYQGTELQYKERSLYVGNQRIEGGMQIDAESSADTATSFLYIITFLHLLHVAVTLFYMLSLSIRSFTGTLERHNYISLRMGAIFWHFLGVLWIYLLLFLLFIH